ncbi:MAG: hypothetical protein K2X93_07450 [Candidatus Obscuribacterales bacterium]|nr:hypothetical protein [Candidatus Obscuribacterales bacterium]
MSFDTNTDAAIKCLPYIAQIGSQRAVRAAPVTVADERSETLMADSRALARKPLRTEWSLAGLGRQALRSADQAHATCLFQQQFERAMLSKQPEDIAEAATDLAFLCISAGKLERAGRLYLVALRNWMLVKPHLAIKSARVISAYALFLHDYSNFLIVRDDLNLAARVRRRLTRLADRFSAFTVYSALAKKLRERGQQRQSEVVLQQARSAVLDLE